MAGESNAGLVDVVCKDSNGGGTDVEPGYAGSAPALALEKFGDHWNAATEEIGAAHALDLRYLFDMGGATALDAAQRTLADQMIAYWSRFVTTGNPDVPGQPAWPALDPQRPQQLSLQTGEPVLTGDFAERHKCDFWAARG